MCNRYRATTDHIALMASSGVTLEPEFDNPPLPEFFSRRCVWVVRQDQGERVLDQMMSMT
jgi:hypothetical protein